MSHGVLPPGGPETGAVVDGETTRRRGWGWILLVPGMLYLGVVITAFGYLLWTWGLARAEASRAAVFITVQPVVGALLGVLFLHEPLTAFTVAGGALVVAGLWLTATGQR